MILWDVKGHLKLISQTKRLILFKLLKNATLIVIEQSEAIRAREKKNSCENNTVLNRGLQLEKWKMTTPLNLSQEDATLSRNRLKRLFLWAHCPIVTIYKRQRLNNEDRMQTYMSHEKARWDIKDTLCSELSCISCGRKSITLSMNFSCRDEQIVLIKVQVEKTFRFSGHGGTVLHSSIVVERKQF